MNRANQSLNFERSILLVNDPSPDFGIRCSVRIVFNDNFTSMTSHALTRTGTMVKSWKTIATYSDWLVQLFAGQRRRIFRTVRAKDFPTIPNIQRNKVFLYEPVTIHRFDFKYLQWCLRLPSQNSVLHPIQRSTAWSGTHKVGAGPKSSTASQDMSEGKDSPCSPVLPTESGSEPFKIQILFLI